MPRYYTRVCNFYHGTNSKRLVKEKKSLPLNGNKEISFDRIQIISRKFQKECFRVSQNFRKSSVWNEGTKLTVFSY